MSNLLEIKKFRQKNKIIEKILMDYKKIRYINPDIFMVCEKEEIYLEDIQKYYRDLKEKVDYILLQMDKELSKVIYNEYLINDNTNWWMYVYSKSTYYRMKNKAMTVFLEWWYA